MLLIISKFNSMQDLTLRTMQGIYRKHKNGMGGIVQVKELDQEILININKDAESFALDKDIVEVEFSTNQDASETAKLNGKITQVVKHNTNSLVGYVQVSKNRKLLKVSDSKFGGYLVEIKSTTHYDREQLYNSTIVSYPTKETPYFVVEITNTIASVDEDIEFINNLINENALPHEFSHSVMEYVESLPDEVSPTDMLNRQDLRHLPFITIDGEDAKDFDDAVYSFIKDDVFHLYVAIADVAHYVKDDSILDNEAYLRGTSVYFPKQVIPMLPEKLSNNLCSLKPNVDRLVMCVHMRLNTQGSIIGYEVFNGVIHSVARLTYNKVEQYLQETSLIPTDLIESITSLYLVYKNLLISRQKRGAIDFDSIEAQFQFDVAGIVSQIIPRVRLEAHKLIEECMLAANVCVADFLLNNSHPGLFRVHDKPSLEKFTQLKEYLNSVGINFDVSYERLTPGAYADLLRAVNSRDNFVSIQQAALRSMQLAIYSHERTGHFGLSYDRYLHFTSPIRRYPDLLVHRAAKAILNKQHYTYRHSLANLGEHTSFTERRAEDMGRKVDAYYKCQYAKTHIGSTFTGVISSIIHFGLFIYIPDLMLDGLLHVTQLGNDYFIFDDKSQILVGKKTGFKYISGQSIIVEIVDVDMAKLFIDLKLANDN